jgi:hypothetical protein
VRYEVAGDPLHHALCHCTDCRRSAGAPMVSWALFPREAVTIAGETQAYASSEHAERHFCPRCGTGLFYTSEAIFPGQIDVQSATLDDPDTFPLQLHVQTAERIGWMRHAHDLPQFERYPEESAG